MLGLAGIAGSAIDYRNGCGIPALAVGANCAVISGYAVLTWEVEFNHRANASLYLLLLCVITGIGIIGNGIFTYILRPSKDQHKRMVDTSLLVFLVFTACGLAFVFTVSLLAITNPISLTGAEFLFKVAGVMFAAAFLAELTGIVLAFTRVLQSRART
jgi:hypothetical protein